MPSSAMLGTSGTLGTLGTYRVGQVVLWGQVEHGHKKAGPLGPAQCIY